MLDDLRFRLRALLGRDAMEAELTDELRFHFDQEVEKYKRSGMTHGEAMRRARISFGGQERVEEDCREARGTNLVESSMQDVAYGLRAMRKNPGFFGIAALTLALGIGASTAVFSVVDTILLKPLPYPNANRIVMPWRVGPIGTSFSGMHNLPWSPMEFNVLSQTATVFQSLGGFKKESFNLTGSSGPQLLEGVRASAGFFPALGVSPLLGRTFTAGEDQPGHERVAVLSNRLWRSRFGGDAKVLDTTIHLNGYPYTVIGVMPASFTFPNTDGIPPLLDLPKETELWVPLALPANARGANEFGVIGYLKPEVGLAQVQQDLDLFEKRLEEQIPQIKGWSAEVIPLTQQTVMDARRPLLLLLGAVSVVLLIACSNVAGLTLNRSVGRRRELTLRGALGARRGRLIRQLMIESLLLAGVGGLAGILLGESGLYLLRLFGPNNIPHLQETGLDLRVVAYALGITVAAGVLFGLAPAIGATRLNMVDALKEGQRSGGSAIAPKIRSALLIVQVALALVLVVSAGLLVRTFYSMLHSRAGFDVARVVTFELPLPSSKYSDTDRMAQLYQQVLQKLQAAAGVQAAGLVSVVPMGGDPDGTVIRIPEHPTPLGSQAPYANYSFVSPGYFATIGTPLVRGRDITDADILSSVPVTIINTAMANKYFHGEDPIGKQVGVGLVRIPVRTIIGVVDDIKHASLREDPDSEMFVPYTQNEIKTWPSMQTMQFAVRTKADPDSITGSLRQVVQSVDADLSVAKLATLASLVDDSITADRFSMILVGSFGVLSLLLAAIGMFGVISYSVMQRTPEIGIRMAFGARRGEIFLMVLSQASRLAGVGIASGLIAAAAGTRLMTKFLYGVRPTDPITFVVVSFLLMAVVLLACYLPARRATKVDPMIALRTE